MSDSDPSQQRWNPDTYQANAGFVPEYGNGVLAWLAPQPGEQILDLGCGDGVLTQKIREAGAEVLGVDASAELVAAAKARGLAAEVMDGHQLTLPNESRDAVFSNAALHWMLEPERVLAGLAKTLKPGGRFVGELGGFGNVAAIVTAMRAVGSAMHGNPALAGPWFYPTVELYRSMLVCHGFEVRRIETFYRQTPLKTGIRGWLETMRGPFFQQFGDRQEAAYEAVIAALRPSLCAPDGCWFADYVRLRFEAVLSSRGNAEA